MKDEPGPIEVKLLLAILSGQDGVIVDGRAYCAYCYEKTRQEVRIYPRKQPFQYNCPNCPDIKFIGPKAHTFTGRVDTE